MMMMAVPLKMRLIFLFAGLLWYDSVFGDVERLEQSNFEATVTPKSYVLVLFKSSEECPECAQALNVMESLATPERLGVQERVLEKRYVSDEALAERFGATNYPALVFFREGNPTIYDGPLSEGSNEMLSLEYWLDLAIEIPEATQILTDDTFEHLTQASTGATTGDWFVLFYQGDCQDCYKVFPALETAALRTKVRMNFAKVDVNVNMKLAKRFQIKDSPSGILFKQGKMYDYEPRKFDANSLQSFVDGWYRNVKAMSVPKQPTAFDELTESIAMSIKEILHDPRQKSVLIMGAVAVTLVLVLIIVLVFRKPSNSRRKFD